MPREEQQLIEQLEERIEKGSLRNLEIAGSDASAD